MARVTVWGYVVNNQILLISNQIPYLGQSVVVTQRLDFETKSKGLSRCRCKSASTSSIRSEMDMCDCELEMLSTGDSGSLVVGSLVDASDKRNKYEI